MNQYFIAKLLIDILAIAFLVGLLHYRLYKKSEYIFTYTIFNVIIFMLSYVLKSNEMSAATAFGLFGVFSMIRYRTEDISARDMTYLFIVMALGLLNAMHSETNTNEVLQLVAFNAVIVFVTWLLESSIIMKRESVQSIQYEHIQNIKPENLSILLADLSERTGLTVHRVEIGKIDFLRDTAVVKIYYYSAVNK
jgi:Domain of unknown function (DUF4956)